MHQEVRDWLAKTWLRWSGPLDILEIGSLNVNGSAREYFEQIAGSYVGVDIRRGPGVDLHMDALDLPEDGPLYDLIVSTEVLEHAPRAGDIVVKAGRLLRPGGWLVITCASDKRKPHNAYGAEHPEPDEFYQGVRASQLAGWVNAAGLCIIELTELAWPGDLRLIAWKAAGV